MNEIINLNDEVNKGDWKKVQWNRRESRKTCIGTSEHKINELASSTKRAWLHVGKCTNTTTTDIVKSYVETKNANIQVRGVEMLESKGNNRAFKVVTDYHHLEELMNPAFWPAGIAVRRYTFPNTQQNKPAQVTQ